MNGIVTGANTPSPTAAPTFTSLFARAIRVIYYALTEVYIFEAQLPDRFGLCVYLALHSVVVVVVDDTR